MLRRLPLITFLVVLFAVGKLLCAQEQPLPANVQKDLEEVIFKQSLALKKARVEVLRAFEYREAGHDGDDDKTVAVEVTFSNFTPDFDYDDIEVIDAEDEKVYEARELPVMLNDDGTVHLAGLNAFDGATKIRAAFLFQVPRSTKKVHLRYWDQRLTTKSVPLTKGKLHYRKVPQLAGLQRWPYPDKAEGWFDNLQRDEWLFVNYSILTYGTCVVDLKAWPPSVTSLPWQHVAAAERAPGKGWVFVTITGVGSQQVRYPIWLHRAERPGETKRASSASLEGREYLHGIAVLGHTIFAYSDSRLFRFIDGKLALADEVGPAEGKLDPHLPRVGKQTTHGVLRLGGGKSALLWDGDGYEIVDGRLKKTWKLGINDKHGFRSVPAEDDSLYFIEEGKAYRVSRGGERERVMKALDNVQDIQLGPARSLLFEGWNQDDIINGIWHPEEDVYTLIKLGEFGERVRLENTNSLHWSDTTRHFYCVGDDCIYTVPAQTLLKRQRVKLPPAADAKE